MAIYFIFVVISSVFWLLVKLSQDYTTTIEYPVIYSGFPKKLALVSDLPATLKIKVNAYGYTLLINKFFDEKKPVLLDFDNFKLKRVEKNFLTTYFLIPVSVKDSLVSQLNDEFKIIAIEPDTLFFYFSEKQIKKVRVKPNLKLTFADNYSVFDSVSCVPEFVTLTGPKSSLNNISYIETNELKYNKLDTILKIKTGLKIPQYFESAEKEVTVKIPCEKFNEFSTLVSVTAINIPENCTVKLVPDHVTVNYKIALKNIDKVSNTNFKAFVDFNQCDSVNSNAKTLKIKISGYQKNLYKVEAKPDFVNYFTEKK